LSMTASFHVSTFHHYHLKLHKQGNW